MTEFGRSGMSRGH